MEQVAALGPVIAFIAATSTAAGAVLTWVVTRRSAEANATVNAVGNAETVKILREQNEIARQSLSEERAERVRLHDELRKSESRMTSMEHEINVLTERITQRAGVAELATAFASYARDASAEHRKIMEGLDVIARRLSEQRGGRGERGERGEKGDHGQDVPFVKGGRTD